MDYISVKEAAEKWGITGRMVNYHCASGRIEGAQKIGNMWVVPKDAVKPADGRRKQAEKADHFVKRVKGDRKQNKSTHINNNK